MGINPFGRDHYDCLREKVIQITWFSILRGWWLGYKRTASTMWQERICREIHSKRESRLCLTPAEPVVGESYYCEYLSRSLYGYSLNP